MTARTQTGPRHRDEKRSNSVSLRHREHPSALVTPRAQASDLDPRAALFPVRPACTEPEAPKSTVLAQDAAEARHRAHDLEGLDLPVVERAVLPTPRTQPVRACLKVREKCG